jgi:phosphoglycolate phosphatase
MTFKNVKNIIWDFNGTLLNDVSICLKSINPLLKNRNLPEIDKLKYQEVFTFPVIEYYKAIGFNFENEPFEIPAMQFIDNYRANLPQARLFIGINELLGRLKTIGIQQAILSAMEEPFLIETLNQLGIANYFNEIAGIQDHYAHSKVNRGLNLIKSQNFHTSETLLIGDTLHDMEVATELGIQCILLSHGHQSYNRLCVNGNVVVENLKALEDVLIQNLSLGL